MKNIRRNPLLVAAINLVGSTAICLLLKPDMGIPSMLFWVGTTTVLSFVGSLRFCSMETC